MKKIFILLLCFVTLISLSVCSAATVTKILDKDTSLHPQGWVSGSLKFKGGTEIIINEQGEVIQGILKFRESLLPVGNCYSKSQPMTVTIYKEIGRIQFKADSYPVTFNNNGQVISGMLGETCSINLTGKKDATLRFKENTIIVFNDDASVSQGTIQEDYELRPINWQKLLPLDENVGFIKFADGSEIIFGADGQVIKGTIAKDFKNYKSGTTILFSELK